MSSSHHSDEFSDAGAVCFGKVGMLMLWRLTPRVETGTSQLPVGHQRRALLNAQGSRLVEDDPTRLGGNPA